jgi:hypothetical protein
MTNIIETPLLTATENLTRALDSLPRNQWKQSIVMALQAVFDLGYAEGYRIGAFKIETTTPLPVTIHDNSGKINSFAEAHNMAEDRALATDKRSAAEEIEERGYEVIRSIAKQLGQHNVDPDEVIVGFTQALGGQYFHFEIKPRKET